MVKYLLASGLLLSSVAVSAKGYPLQPFNSLFVRGKMIVKARHSNKNGVKAYLSADLQPLLQVMQIKGSVFVQMNPFKKSALKKPIRITVYYTTPLKQVTAIQGASLSIGRVTRNGFRVGGSGNAFVKVVKPGNVQSLTVTLNRKSKADVSFLKAQQCRLTIGKQSQLEKSCSNVIK